MPVQPKHRSLLKLLLELANAGEVLGWRMPNTATALLQCKSGRTIAVPLDATRDAKGRPIFELSSIHVQGWTTRDWTDAQTKTKALLDRLAVDDADGMGGFEAEVNGRGLGVRLFSWRGAPSGRTVTSRGILRGDRGGPGMLVPTAPSGEDLPYAILALARCTPTGQGDSLADRISKCQECGKFFLLPTRKCSRFCSESCRGKAINRRRREAGDFTKKGRAKAKERRGKGYAPAVGQCE